MSRISVNHTDGFTTMVKVPAGNSDTPILIKATTDQPGNEVAALLPSSALIVDNATTTVVAVTVFKESTGPTSAIPQTGGAIFTKSQDNATLQASIVRITLFGVDGSGDSHEISDKDLPTPIFIQISPNNLDAQCAYLAPDGRFSYDGVKRATPEEVQNATGFWCSTKRLTFIAAIKIVAPVSAPAPAPSTVTIEAGTTSQLGVILGSVFGALVAIVFFSMFLLCWLVKPFKVKAEEDTEQEGQLGKSASSILPVHSYTKAGTGGVGANRKVSDDASELEEAATASIRRGIKLLWVIDVFPKIVGRKMPGVENPTFLMMSSIIAYGDQALGKGKICPRDGQPDSSIVDAVFPNGNSDKATVFLSWVWSYSLHDACSALERWYRQQTMREDHFLWWCFYSNNQFRFLNNAVKQTPETLSLIFGSNLKEIGHMLIMLNSLSNPLYTQRIWCIFEVFEASLDRTINVELTIPSSALPELDTIRKLPEALQVQAIKSCLGTIDTAKAEATSKEDERAIKDMIEAKSGDFQEVNKLVRERLGLVIFNELDFFS
jgi:hypothetical protein